MVYATALVSMVVRKLMKGVDDVAEEAKIERKLKQKIQASGGICWKLSSPGTLGVPDRLIIRKGKVYFVELKAPGQKPRASQRTRANQLRRVGAHVYCISNMDQVESFCKELKKPGYPNEENYDSI